MSLFYTDPTVVDEQEVIAAAAERAHIPAEIFKEVLKWLPIATSDFVLTRKLADGRKQFLLGYRAEAPFQNTWFVPGGRINWGESPDAACKRHIKRELGIGDVSPRFVGHVNVINPASETRPLWHSVWHLYEVPVSVDIEIKQNNENAKVHWFTGIDRNWPDPVREALFMLGFE